jgi:hypothetical protein
MISLKHKAIFAHVPKSGGTSIESAFGEKVLDSEGKHSNIQDLKAHMCSSAFHVNGEPSPERGKEAYDNFFKFTFVRNPFASLYSFYCFHKRVTEDWKNGLRPDSSIYNMENIGGFEDFVLTACSQGADLLATGKDLKSNCIEHFDALHQKQFAYIDDSMEVNFIGRFENLQKDFSLVAKVVGLNKGLPHENNSGNKSPYWMHYSYDSRNAAEKMFKEDLDTFNYCF